MAKIISQDLLQEMSIGKELESKEENTAPENKWPEEKKTKR